MLLSIFWLVLTHTHSANTPTTTRQRSTLASSYQSLTKQSKCGYHQLRIPVDAANMTEARMHSFRDSVFQYFVPCHTNVQNSMSICQRLFVLSLPLGGQVVKPNVWNSSPQSLRKTQCFTTFIKTHLFQIHLC